ncbi:hypothetical protein [Tamlana crocina]|uniref:Uncharacterized protein n=1 Tax=Tamlana crocina TaxID=393006 RepID=A0ABX1DAT0_9FLAO|nr:hypothetical protein [Tamlana crocina]NJX14148.1 hypothetical protein [Tamlana crocina]
MLKFSHIFLAVVISFLSLHFNRFEEQLDFGQTEHAPQKHEVQNYRLHNAFGIAPENTFEHVLNLKDVQENLVEHPFAYHSVINGILLSSLKNYIKTSSFIAPGLSLKALIFPFHSFL